jgi:F-type H+-transporting ATPase subunit epsilon
MALTVTLVSAEEEVWHGEANLVVAKTVEGEIGFMTGHEPVLAILAEGQVRITQSDGTKVVAVRRTASSRWRRRADHRGRSRRSRVLIAR